MEEKKGGFYGCSFPLNFDRTQPGTVFPLTALTSMDLRLSLKIYKAMVTFEMEKTLADLVLVTLVVGIWSQVERKGLWEGWGW